MDTSIDRVALPAPSLSEVARHGLRFITDDGLFEACGVRIAFTQRAGGVSEGPCESLNLGLHVDDDRAAVLENRRRLVRALREGDADGGEELFVPNQVHGDTLVALEEGCDLPAQRVMADEGCDGVVCLMEDVPVCLCFADCTPVILVAPTGGFAVAHAGWRGAVAGIAGKAARELCKRTGCSASELNAYIGPHIGACCYEVSQEVLDRFVAAYGPACDAGSRHLSLSAAVRCDLERARLAPKRIQDVLEEDAFNACTSCNSRGYYSYRANAGVTGRHGAAACRPASVRPAQRARSQETARDAS